MNGLYALGLILIGMGISEVYHRIEWKAYYKGRKDR